MSEIRAKLRKFIAENKFVSLTLPILGDVKVRVLTVGDVDDGNAKSASASASATRMASLIAEHLHDAEGRRLFNSESPADIAEIRDIPLHVSTQIMAAINGGNFEAAAKNSAPSAGSSSG